ncbi:hypothetical protein ElyMa_006790200 [Elysia marginata]|uniref:Uncharacterized protein n=1 Tax=Elysia marginata TaxID=1093978 RepID=A0AAV4J0B0_9GAST|nr:hypothetical protein ElyMa_006790200 [Elysia marginata]
MITNFLQQSGRQAVRHCVSNYVHPVLSHSPFSFQHLANAVFFAQAVFPLPAPEATFSDRLPSAPLETLVPSGAHGVASELCEATQGVQSVQHRPPLPFSCLTNFHHFSLTPEQRA